MDKPTKRMVDGAFAHFQRYSEGVWKERPADFYIERTLRLYRGDGNSRSFEKLADFVQPSALVGLGDSGFSEGAAGLPLQFRGAFAGLLVGSYGTGKTEFAYRLCEYLRSKDDALFPTPFPVSLSRCRGKQSLLDSRPERLEFLDLLREGLPVRLRRGDLWNELRKAVREGRVFLVLDALDELVEREHHHRNFISGLRDFLLDDDEDVSNARFRVLVTMRREYLSVVDGPRISGTLEAWTPRAADVLYLLELNQFGDSEMREYFARRHGDRGEGIFDDLVQAQQLLSMLRRPLLLRIFADYLAAIDGQQGPTEKLAQLGGAAGGLIEAYVEQVHESGRQLQKDLGSIFFWSKEKLARKSVELFANGESELYRSDVKDIRVPLSGGSGLEDPLVSVHKCPFLLREGSHARFAHRTFFEFFAAKGIAMEVNAKGLEEADGFNNLVVNSDMRKFLQYFLPDFYDLIKLSCGLLKRDGWEMSPAEYLEIGPRLDEGLRILTEGMTAPEVARDDVEAKVEWFLKECNPLRFHPGYMVYCFHAVATYMLERPWADRVLRWRNQFESLLRTSLDRALIERLTEGSDKDGLERLAERVLFIGQKLRYHWIQEYVREEKLGRDGGWHPQTWKRVKNILEDIRHTQF
jgi:hypothetical protein